MCWEQGGLVDRGCEEKVAKTLKGEAGEVEGQLVPELRTPQRRSRALGAWRVRVCGEPAPGRRAGGITWTITACPAGVLAVGTSISLPVCFSSCIQSSRSTWRISTSGPPCTASRPPAASRTRRASPLSLPCCARTPVSLPCSQLRDESRWALGSPGNGFQFPDLPCDSFSAQQLARLAVLAEGFQRGAGGSCPEHCRGDAALDGAGVCGVVGSG